MHGCQLGRLDTFSVHDSAKARHVEFRSSVIGLTSALALGAYSANAADIYAPAAPVATNVMGILCPGLLLGGTC